ncbi:MAG: hypothetical protein EB127_06170 [Alphaproteobacteria bacterium]|nr:hypothetical protein [Alphaproteobacteria bacterium]
MAVLRYGSYELWQFLAVQNCMNYQFKHLRTTSSKLYELTKHQLFQPFFLSSSKQNELPVQTFMNYQFQTLRTTKTNITITGRFISEAFGYKQE